MPDFLCKSAHRVGERQGGAIVAKLEAALDAACRRVKFPIGNLGEIGCTLFARERVDAASARNAGTLRERRHHSFTLWRPPLYPTSHPIHRVSPHRFSIHHSMIQIETGERECLLAARDVAGMIAAAGASALMASYASLILSFAEPPSGPAIVLVAGFIYLLSLALGPVGGLIWLVLQGRHLKA